MDAWLFWDKGYRRAGLCPAVTVTHASSFSNKVKAGNSTWLPDQGKILGIRRSGPSVG